MFAAYDLVFSRLQPAFIGSARGFEPRATGGAARRMGTERPASTVSALQPHDTLRSRVPPERIPILGIPLDAVDASAARSFLRGALTEPWNGRCRHIVTLNPEYVMAARRDPAFAGAIHAADLIVADGVGVAVAARWLGATHARGVGRVTGTDLADWAAAESGPMQTPIFLLGGRPGVGAAAAAALARRFPQVRIAGHWAGGSARPEDDASAIARIAAGGARAVLVAYGAPGQVIWIERNRAALAAAGVRLAIGVGGTMDYLAGRVPRAPASVRRLGFEWLYRLAIEPWRGRRQLVLPRFALLAGLTWLWRRGNRARRWVRLMNPGARSAAGDRGARPHGLPGEESGARTPSSPGAASGSPRVPRPKDPTKA